MNLFPGLQESLLIVQTVATSFLASQRSRAVTRSRLAGPSSRAKDSPCAEGLLGRAEIVSCR